MERLNYDEIFDNFATSFVGKEIKKETRHYAKRQLTWFRKNKQTIWIDGEKPTDYNANLICSDCNI